MYLSTWNTLQEAADYMSGESGEIWTQRRILDAGAQGLIHVQAVLPPSWKIGVLASTSLTGNTISMGPAYLKNLLIYDKVEVPGNLAAVDPRRSWPAIFSHVDLRIDGHDLKAFAAKRTTPAKAEVNTTPSDGTPGKIPKTAIGKLALKAALQIESKTGKRATAGPVIEMLQEWESTEPVIAEKIAHGVKWVTVKGVVRKYDIQTCARTLELWNKSRA